MSIPQNLQDLVLTDDEFARMTRYANYTGLEDARRRAVLMGFDKPDTIVQNGSIVRLSKEGSVGENVVIALHCYINGHVTVEDNVLIGPGCAITAGHHKFDPATGWFSARTEPDGDDSIVIGWGSWLCANVVVTAGVKLGRANLVCAGAVVTKSTADHAIMAGTPAKQIGRIDTETGEYIWFKDGVEK
ncbi:MAG: acyltransferase [Defluviitaleaceae bacterium]|nr:acyltransferase [Defluviitaleaceae bacterium]